MVESQKVHKEVRDQKWCSSIIVEIENKTLSICYPYLDCHHISQQKPDAIRIEIAQGFRIYFHF